MRDKVFLDTSFIVYMRDGQVIDGTLKIVNPFK